MIIDYINGHQGEFWIALGFLILAIELLVMGLSTGVLLFVGLGALLTGLSIQAGLLPASWTAGVSGLGISSGLGAVLLWRPLRRMQGQRAPGPDRSSDLIGLEFALEQPVSRSQPGSQRYSGIQWRVELDPEAAEDALAAGQRVVVSSVDVGLFRVKPV